MKKNFWSVYVPPTKEQLERNLKYYKEELERLNDNEYVKKLIEGMKQDLRDNIKECENEIKELKELEEIYDKE